MSEEKFCAYCGKQIEEDDDCYTCLDNFLQVKYFDSPEDNIFCSEHCFCKALSLADQYEADRSDMLMKAMLTGKFED